MAPEGENGAATGLSGFADCDEDGGGADCDGASAGVARGDGLAARDEEDAMLMLARASTIAAGADGGVWVRGRAKMVTAGKAMYAPRYFV